jgi:hypothetical protein
LTLYANFDDQDGNPVYAGDVATTRGWGEFTRWAETLPVKKFGLVVHLAEHGWAPDLADLERQLGKALKRATGSARSTCETLLALLEKRGDSEGIYISDGTGDESEDAGLDAEAGAIDSSLADDDRLLRELEEEGR